MAPHITDPVQSLERVYARMDECERNIADYAAQGFRSLEAAERRRLRSLKAAASRIAKLI